MNATALTHAAARRQSDRTLPRGARLIAGVPVVLPNRRDPRLKVAAVIVSLQVLGQTVLHFKVSIAQILLTIGVCGAVEMLWLWREHGALIWPASALLTGNGVAFILRTTGTRHGDWWSLNGWYWFLLAALIGLGSKYVLTLGGRHPYNPSNLGLVAVLLAVGSPDVYPQYLWWGPLHAPVIAALAVICLGVVWILRPLGMLPMAAAFLLPFVGLVWLLGHHGHCFTAIWSASPVCGSRYVSDICTSPELLIFVFYMMSDPRTTPRGTRGRIGYGVATAVLAAVLIRSQPTEYGVKVALLAALTLVCSAVPLKDAWDRGILRPLTRRLMQPAVVAMLLIAVAVPVQLTALAHDRAVIDLEHGVTPTGRPATQ